VRVEGGNEFVSDNRLWARHEDFAQGPSGFLVPVIKFRWLVHMARQIAPLGHQDFVRILDYRQGVIIVETCGVGTKKVWVNKEATACLPLSHYVPSDRRSVRATPAG
jgi:hypothetical protein